MSDDGKSRIDVELKFVYWASPSLDAAVSHDKKVAVLIMDKMRAALNESIQELSEIHPNYDIDGSFGELIDVTAQFEESSK